MEKNKILLSKVLSKEKYVISILFLFALTVRLLYFVSVSHSPDFTDLCYDGRVFNDLAQDIINGNIFLSNYKTPFEMSPGYTYFLAMVSKLFQGNFSLIKVFQWIIGSLNCVLIYFIGKKLFNKWVGLIAFVIAAYYGMFVFFEGILMPEFLILFFNSWVFLFLLKAKEKPIPRYWVLSGIFLGLSGITRPNVLLFVPFVLFWIYSLNGISKKERFRALGYVCLALSMVILPITIRNYIIADDLVLITDSGGANFYGGNNPSSQGVFITNQDKYKYLINPAELVMRKIQISAEMNEHQRDRAVAELLLGKKVKPSYASGFWFKQGLKNILKDPFWWFTLEIKKGIIIFNNFEVQDGDIPFLEMKQISSLLRIFIFNYGIICPLGLVGIFLTFKQRNKFKIIYFFMFSYIVSMLIFHTASRYRLPLVPFFIIFGAYTLYFCYMQIKEKRWDLLFSPVIIFVILAGVINYDDTFGYDFEINRTFIPMHEQKFNFFIKNKRYVDATDPGERLTELNPNSSEAFTNLGWAYFSYRALDKAIESYKRAIDLNPHYFIAYIDLALAYYAQGAISDAIDLYRKIDEMHPHNPFIYNILGGFLAEKGQNEEARQKLKYAIDFYPANMRFSLDLANFFFTTEEYDNAIKGYEYILKYDPKNEKIKKYLEIVRLENEIKDNPLDKKTIALYQKVGSFWYSTGNYDRAIEKMEKLVALSPGNVGACYNLAQAYKGSGDFQKAKSMYEKALKLKPDFIEAAMELDNLQTEE